MSPDPGCPASELPPVRVLAIIGSLNRGGCERHLAQVLPALDATRVNAEVFVLDERGELANAIEDLGITVRAPWCRGGENRNILLRVCRLVAISFQLWLYLINRRPNIVHFFLPASYLIGAPVAIAAAIRCRILSRRSLDNYQRARPMLAVIEHALHRTTTAFIGNARAVVQQLVDKEGVPAERTAVIYNGVQIPDSISMQHREKARSNWSLDPDTVVMVIVANLIPYKGHADLLRACARAREKLPGGWKLLIVGRDDGIGDELARLAEELKLSEHVRFLGERDDVESILQVCDIGLLVSHQEGFSNAILECMAAGLPMIVTDIGGNAEAVVDGKTGRVVPLGDQSALADAIIELASDKNLRYSMGKAGRQRASEYFGVEHCVQAYEQLYEAVAHGHSVGKIQNLARHDQG